jgi:hypothetical protein
MLVKILAGVMAAIAVTGVGIYYAAPDYSLPTCSSHDKAPVDGVAVSEGGGCCMLPGVSDASASETPSCCASTSTTNSDSLAACVGGMALTSTSPTTAAKAPAAHCCEE